MTDPRPETPTEARLRTFQDIEARLRAFEVKAIEAEARAKTFWSKYGPTITHTLVALVSVYVGHKL
jgi:hypothetical protein